MKHCLIHGSRPRPDRCHDCLRLQPAAPLPKLGLTDSLHGQLEIVFLPRTDCTLDRIVVRPIQKRD